MFSVEILKIDQLSIQIEIISIIYYTINLQSNKPLLSKNYMNGKEMQNTFKKKNSDFNLFSLIVKVEHNNKLYEYKILGCEAIGFNKC